MPRAPGTSQLARSRALTFIAASARAALGFASRLRGLFGPPASDGSTQPDGLLLLLSGLALATLVLASLGLLRLIGQSQEEWWG